MPTQLKWYVRRGDQRRGPFNEYQLKVLAESGRLRTSDLVSHVTTSDEYQAGTIPWIFGTSTEIITSEPVGAKDTQAIAANERAGLASLAFIAMILIPFLIPTGTTPLSRTYWVPTVWLLLGTSIVATTLLLILMVRPHSTDREGTYLVFCFTAFLGFLFLLAFQQIADNIDQYCEKQKVVVHWSVMLLRGVAIAYRHADPQSHQHWFVVTFAAMFCSVALCEETVKAFPALLLTLSLKDEISPQAVAFLGAMSGLGFGVAEGFLYSSDLYMPLGGPFSMYVIRFMSCAPLHAAWAGFSSVMIFHHREVICASYRNRKVKTEDNSGGWAAFWYASFLPLIPSMLLHSLYNSWLACNWYWLAVLTVLVSVVLFALAIPDPASDAGKVRDDVATTPL